MRHSPLVDATPLALNDTICFPLRIAACALASRAESGITEILGLIIVVVAEDD